MDRVNRKLGRVFRTYCNTKQSKCPEHLEFFEQAINGNFNDTTGFTPEELHRGPMPKRVRDEYVKCVATPNLPVPNDVKCLETRKRIKESRGTYRKV